VVITANTAFSSFTPGNLAVLSADNALTNNSTFSIFTLSPSTANQTSVQFESINGTVGSPGTALRVSGSAASAPRLADSGDGSLLVFAGFNTNAAGNTANHVLARGVGTLDINNNYTLQTTYTGTSGNQVINAATLNNSGWYVADAGGIYTNGTTATVLANTHLQGVKSFGGTLYALEQSGTEVATLSVDATTLTGLTGLSSDANAQDFYLVSSGNNGTTYDELYVLDNTSATAGVINKFSSPSGTAGTWTAQGTYTTAFGGCGLAAAPDGSGGVYLYVATGGGATPGNNVIELDDTAAWNSSISITTGNNVTLYTAGAAATIKGVAFAPDAAPSVTSSAATSIGTTTATLNGNVTATGGATITSRGFIYTIASGSPVTNTVSGTTGAFTSSPTLSVNKQYSFNAYAVNSVGTTLSSPSLSFWTLANTPTAPVVGAVTGAGATTSLTVTIGTGDSNPSGTAYAIKETSTGNYVQSGGSLSGSPVFQTAATWGMVTVTGLTSGTTYHFEVEAENGASTTTSFGPTASGSPASPTITLGSTSLSFSPTAVNGTSAAMSYTVSGVNLTANIGIAAPTGFQISTSSGSGYGSSLTLTQSGGTVASTTIYVEFIPTAQTSYSGNIANTSSGAASQNVSVSGTGATAPSVTTSAATAQTTSGATLNGTVTGSNGSTITDEGFYWSASAGVTTSSTKLSAGITTAGAFSKALTGLSVNTVYYYRAYAANSIGSTLDSSGDTTFYTLANTPTAPPVGSATTSSLAVTIGSGDGNPSGTAYAIYETTTGKYVQSGGALGATAYYQTASAWGTVTVTGLHYGMAYAFGVGAENGASTATAFGPATGAHTLNSGFTPGNLAVMSADTTANNSTFSIIELTTNANQSPAVQTISINGTGSLSTVLRISGSAASAPRLADSGDGSLLVFAGFNTNGGSITGNKTLLRGVGTLDVNNNYTFQTGYTGTSGNQVINAATLNNSGWYVADAAGIYTNGTTSPVLANTKVQGVKSFGATLYALQAGTSASSVSTLSADGTTLTALTGLTSEYEPLASDFYILSSGINGATNDLLYIVTNSSATVGAIKKFYSPNGINGSWTAKGSYATTFGGCGLAAATNAGGGVYLYVATGTGATSPNNVLELDDTALTGTIAVNTTGSNTLYTAASGTTIKGVAFAPTAPTTVQLTSSAPTDAHLSAVTFTATVQTNGVTDTSLGGSVQFETNGVAYGSPVGLTAGVATSVSLATLPWGTTPVTAIYSGVINAYQGSTSSAVSQVVTNNLPVAATLTVSQTEGLTLLIPLSSLATNWSDLDGDPITITNINTVSTNGQTVYLVNVTTNSDRSFATNAFGFIGYAYKANTQADQISYTITDSHGGVTTGYVDIVPSTTPVFGATPSSPITISGSSATVNFVATPGFTYEVQRSTNLVSGAGWVNIGSVSPNGPVFNYQDYFTDLGGVAPGSAYYRLAWTPTP